MTGASLVDLIKRVFQSLYGYQPSSTIIAEIIVVYNAETSSKPPKSSKEVLEVLRKIIEDLYSNNNNNKKKEGGGDGYGGGDDDDKEGCQDEGCDGDDDGAMSAAYRGDRDDLYDGLRKVQRPGDYIFNERDLVLSRKYEWSVPHRRPPVCTSSSTCQNDNNDKKTTGRGACPRRDQTALIGTLLSEAAGTKVGSILPRFLYKEEQSYTPASE
jgi:hypothetical protein